MLFDSLDFILFLPIVVFIYFLLAKKYKNTFLLLASYFFYMQWNAKYIILIGISTVVTYFASVFMENNADNIKKRKFFLVSSLVINLAILFAFKYYGFFASNINSLFSYLHLVKIPDSFDVLLPVGISFYTFQALGYTIDVYRKEVTAERNFINYALFVSFFPQLVAGPIERSKNLIHQINEEKRFTANNFKQGMFLIMIGFFMKLVIADRLAIPVNAIYENSNLYSGFGVLLGAALFSFQLYCDFNSYSIIAKGSAKLLGYDLMDNFRQPFLALSIKELWQRWHISLSTWFKDYLYIPLGGSRVSKLRNAFNIMTVFTLSGLWHGADAKFIIWGAFHGMFLVIYLIRDSLFTNGLKSFLDKNFIARTLRIGLTFMIFTFSMFFFRADSYSIAINMIKRVFSNFSLNVSLTNELMITGMSSVEIKLLIISLVLLIIYDLLREKFGKLESKYANCYFVFRMPIALLLIFLSMIFGIYGSGFSETDFIYFQF